MVTIIIFWSSLGACVALLVAARYVVKEDTFAKSDALIKAGSLQCSAMVSRTLDRVREVMKVAMNRFWQSFSHNAVAVIDRHRQKFSNNLRGRRVLSKKRTPSAFFDKLHDSDTREK